MNSIDKSSYLDWATGLMSCRKCDYALGFALATVALSAVGCGGSIASDATGGSSGYGGSSSQAGSSVGGALSTSVLADGSSSTVMSGGHWWTYTDHNPEGSMYHATVSPLTDANTALEPVDDTDVTHGRVFRANGKVPGRIPWTQVVAQDPVSVDTYWQALYPDAMIVSYPEAGIGFGFQAKNVPFDATANGTWYGIAFDMKTDVDTQLVWVSMPTEDTDLPDPSQQDQFSRKCQYFTKANNPDFGGETCFTHYRKGIFSELYGGGTPTNTLGSRGQWKRYCVLFSELAIPNWANSPTLDMMPGFDPRRVTKVVWDMFQPADGANAAPFDVSIDNVSFINFEQALNSLNNCDQARVGLAPGTGDAG